MRMTELGNLFSFINRGKAPSYVDASNVCVINQACIRWDKIDFSKAKYQDEDCINDAAILMDGDLLVASTGTGTLGRCSVFYAPDDRIYMADTHVTIVRGTKSYSPYVIMCYMMMDATQQQLYAQCVNGSTNQIELSRDKLRRFLVPELDAVEQEIFVQLASCLKRSIELRQRQLRALDTLIKARFVEMFGDPMTNAKGYELKKYGDVFELNAGGTPSKNHPEYWEGGTISWIGSNMCQDRYIYENDGKYITQEGYDNSSARLFPIDTVLVALVGATIGKTALLKFETTTNQNVLGIRGIRESGYLPEFVYYFTQGLYKKFIGISDGGFSMASKGFISELPIPVVPLALQEEFTSFADQVDKSKVVVQAALDKARVMFDGLMQEYFG